jgi:hypothetical protein
MDSIRVGAAKICKAIQAALENDSGLLVGRNGTIELSMMMQDGVDIGSAQILERNAGIFPITQQSIFYKWRDASIRATQSADVIAAGWYEPLREAEVKAFETWQVKAATIPLRSLEPYYVEPQEQWTRLLSGHSVAVVSSFTKTAAAQVIKGSSQLWGDKNVIPDNVDWSWIQTGHPRSIARGRNEWPPHVHSWQQAAKHVVSEVVLSGARFALIGCGGLGMPIGKMLKDRGVIAIVLGGAIQVLFGIKGNRWQTHNEIHKFWNDEWVWPSEEETPAGASSVESACYWKPM